MLVPAYPIPVELTREEAEMLRGAELRKRLLDESGRKIYDDGMAVWADGDPAGRQSIDQVSTAGALYRALDLVGDSTHSYLMILAALLGVVSLILAAVLVISIHWAFMRLLVMGIVLLVASMPGLATAVAVRFALKGAQAEGDSFVDEMLEVGVDAVWLPIRMYLALTMVGFATIGVATFGLWWDSRPGREPVTAPDQPGSGSAARHSGAGNRRHRGSRTSSKPARRRSPATPSTSPSSTGRRATRSARRGGSRAR